MAEGGGLLNRCTVKSCTGGSNPPLSAITTNFSCFIVKLLTFKAPEEAEGGVLKKKGRITPPYFTFSSPPGGFF